MIRSGSAALLGIALALSFAATGCKSKKKAAKQEDAPAEAAPAEAAPAPARDDRPVVGVITQVIFQTLDPDEAREVHSDEHAREIGRALVASPHFVDDPSKVPDGSRGHRVEIAVTLGYDVVEGTLHGGSSLVATVEASLRWLDGGPRLPVSEHVLLERPLDKDELDDIDALLPDHIAQAIAKAAEGLIAREALRRGTDAEVISALSLDDPHRRAWALAIAGDRKLRDAVVPAAAALDHDSEMVRAAAMAALVAIGDPAAVDAMTGDVDFKDYDGVRVLIEAVSAIGGDDAAAFLEFVATGHPDPGIRTRATEALDRVKAAREGAAPDSATAGEIPKGPS